MTLNDKLYTIYNESYCFGRARNALSDGGTQWRDKAPGVYYLSIQIIDSLVEGAREVAEKKTLLFAK